MEAANNVEDILTTELFPQRKVAVSQQRERHQCAGTFSTMLPAGVEEHMVAFRYTADSTVYNAVL